MTNAIPITHLPINFKKSKKKQFTTSQVQCDYRLFYLCKWNTKTSLAITITILYKL